MRSGVISNTHLGIQVAKKKFRISRTGSGLPNITRDEKLNFFKVELPHKKGEFCTNTPEHHKSP